MFVEAVQAGLLALEHRNAIATQWRRLCNRIKKGTIRVLVVGTGGVGKTTLSRMLTGQLDPFSAAPDYHQSVGIEEVTLPGEIPTILLVGPGQEHRRKTHWPHLLSNLQTAKSCGIIHVVSYGYHSLEQGVPLRNLPLFKQTKTKARFLPAMLDAGRQQEIDLLRDLQPHLQAAQKTLWMMTLVTKQDLWWKSRTAVRKHFSAGEYAQIVDQIRTTRGVPQFSHEFCSASLVMQNFLGGENELLKPTSEGYDQVLRAANWQETQRVLRELCSL